MKYVCQRCGVITEDVDEIPDKCSTCEASSDKFTLVVGDITPIIATEPEEHRASSFGFRSPPDEIKKILKLITIPTGNTPYPGFAKTTLQLFSDKMTNYQVAPGEILSTVLELDKEYFTEMWESGKMVLDSAKTMNKMKVLSAYDYTSIQIDNENNILLHQAGTDAGFSDNVEDPSHVITSKPDMPIPFDYDVYRPKFDEESDESEFKFHVTADAGSFKPLFMATKDKEIGYYPFIIDGSRLRTGVGDMMNPGIEGAFEMNIPINADKSILPDKDVRIEVGPLFKDVLSNLDGEIQICFAGEELPLWVVYDITKPVVVDKKTVQKSFGTMAYIIPPKSD